MARSRYAQMEILCLAPSQQLRELGQHAQRRGVAHAQRLRQLLERLVQQELDDLEADLARFRARARARVS